MDLASHLRSAAWHVGRAAMLSPNKEPYRSLAHELASLTSGHGDGPGSPSDTEETTRFLRQLLLDPRPTVLMDPDTQQIKTERMFASMGTLLRRLREHPTKEGQWSTLVDALALSYAHQQDLATRLAEPATHVRIGSGSL